MDGRPVACRSPQTPEISSRSVGGSPRGQCEVHGGPEIMTSWVVYALTEPFFVLGVFNYAC